MPLKIRHLSGPLAGREAIFADDQEEIRFGRGVDADVSFPEDLSVVSHEHFGLRKEYGGYKFIINPEKPVFMNGRPLYDDQALPKDAEIQLGTLQGPKLRLERQDQYGANQVKTEVLKPQREIAHDLHATSTRSSRTLGLVAGITALVLLLGAGGYFIAQSLRSDVTTVQGDVANVQQQLTQVNTDIPAVRAQLAQLAETNIDAAAIIAKNKESVYLVELLTATGMEYSSATASVVLLPDGRKALATNGHVAEMFEELQSEPAVKGGRLIAIQSKAPDYAVADIVSVKTHPGYAIFTAWQETYYNKTAVQAAQPMDFGVPGYDVALLFVAEPEKLGPPVALASRETIEALKAGDPLVTIGYPAEGLIGTDQSHPDPTSQTGRVVSMTTFFLQTGSKHDNQLVQHSAPSAGGASGSAMFNAKGEVVAFLNAGNVVQADTYNGARISSAAMVNYAQRADLMLDLMDGKADDQVPAIKKAIAEADERLSLPPEKQVERIMETLALWANGKENVAAAGEFEGEMSTPLPELSSPKNYVQTLDITEPGYYFFLLQSEDGRPVIGAMLANGKQVLGPAAAPISYVGAEISQAMTMTVVAADFNAASGENALPTAGKVKIKAFRLPPQE